MFDNFFIIMINVNQHASGCELFIIQISGCALDYLLLISAKLLKVNEKIKTNEIFKFKISVKEKTI